MAQPDPHTDHNGISLTNQSALSPNATPRPSISGPIGVEERTASSVSGTPAGSPKIEAATTNTAPVSRSGSLDVASQNGSGDAVRRSSGKGLPTTKRPVGIINEQNTCFLNSTFQALCATRPLISLLTHSPTSSLEPTSTIPPPIFPASRIPALQSAAFEPPLYDLLPVTRAFLNNLHKAWKAKDTAPDSHSAKSISLRSLLRELARKYDQYDDYRQQDSHELLRHLLDSMEMEEKDVIKKLQPLALEVQPRHSRKKRSESKVKFLGVGAAGLGAGVGAGDGISPMVSPLASPAQSMPGSPEKGKANARGQVQIAGGNQMPVAFSEDERLVPFVDVLFGGSLASVVVCEKCKSVSHTYEGFLDISLSLKGDEPRARKRDKFKALFRPKPSSRSKTNIAETVNNLVSSPIVMSDTELSDTDRPSSACDRRRSLDQDDRRSDNDNGNLSRASSIKSIGLKAKPSFSFRKRGKESSRPGSSSSAVTDDKLAIPDKNDSAGSSVNNVPLSPSGSFRPGSAHSHTSHSNGHTHGLGPTPAQSAYIHRILTQTPAPVAEDPLAKLHAANSGEGLAVNNDSQQGANSFGLLDSLRQFTSVELLEGDNAFACKKCWRITSGKYRSGEPALKEEDEEHEEPRYDSPALSLRRATAPSISVRSDASSDISSLTIDGEPRVGRNMSLSSRSSAGQALVRAPSPLRRQVEEGTLSTSALAPPSASDASDASIDSRSLLADQSVDSISVASGSRLDDEAVTAVDDEEEVSDGLSDTSSSDQEAPQSSVIGRPRMAPRRKSTHFVLRRAFKRYLIAKGPEVLVFHLKRFRQTHKGGMAFTSFYDLKKIDDFVSFPETFDLAPFLAPNRNDYKLAPSPSGPRAPYMDWPTPDHPPELEPVPYKLYAIVVHMGTMVGGHYVAYTLVDPERMFEDGSKVVEAVKEMKLDEENSQGGEGERGDAVPQIPSSLPQAGKKRVWCYCSDTTIRLASVDEVMSCKAYICFYEKVAQ